MKINDYEINYKENELDEILTNKTRKIEFIGPEFEGYQQLSTGDKVALEHLVNAAKIINDVALEQDNPLNKKLKQALELEATKNSHAKKALSLFNALNGVAGFNGIDKHPTQIFKGVKLLKGKNFYPADLSEAELCEILIKMSQRGKIDEIKKILSARTMVRRNDDELIAIDYTDYFAEDFKKIANELELAAQNCVDENFKTYLEYQAKALLHNDENFDMLADKHWADMQDTKLEFTISRENYEDEMTSAVYNNKELADIISEHNIEVVSKDTLGCRVGIVNKSATEYILNSKKTLPYLSKKMPFNEQYEQYVLQNDDVKQTMVDVDIIALTGDYAMCRGGITTAQNLPNNDKLSVKNGYGRRNVYHRQVMFGKDITMQQKLLDRLVAPELHQYIDAKKDIIFVIYHENGHSLGPNAEYQNAMGEYKHIIEEHKADVISMVSVEEIAKEYNMFSQEDLNKIYTSWIFSSLLLKAEPVFSNPHRVAELIQFNFLMENKVIFFDEERKLHINLTDFPKVMYKLLEDTIAVQLSKSVSKAREYVKRWAYWSENSAYIAQVQQEIGTKPYINIVTKF